MDQGAVPEDSSDDMAMLAAGVVAGAPGSTNSLGPAKSVQFSGPVTPSRPLSRKATPFNQELSAEIRKAGLGAVFPDEGRPADDGEKDEGETESSTVRAQASDSSGETPPNADVEGTESKGPRPPKAPVRSKERLGPAKVYPGDD